MQQLPLRLLLLKPQRRCLTDLREAYIAMAGGELGECAALCDGMLRLLAHTSASAPDAAYVAEQRRQFTALAEQCNPEPSKPEPGAGAGADAADAVAESGPGSTMVDPPQAAVPQPDAPEVPSETAP